MIDGEVLPCKGGDDQWVSQFSLDFKTFLSLRKKVYPEMFENAKTQKRRRTRRRRDRVFNCGVGLTAFSINPYGQMNFCIEIDYPKIDILKVGIDQAWDKLKEEVDTINFRAKASDNFICSDCKLLSYCGWCAGRSYIETGKFDQCSEYFKNGAIEQRRLHNRK